MTYNLQRFSADLTAILKAKGIAGLPEIAAKLRPLLVNPEFVAATFDEDMPESKRTLFHDQETDVYVLAHVQPGGRRGSPHSHGRSWAIYGNARGTTHMTEWRRTNPETDDHAELEMAGQYDLGPGQSQAYAPGMIHSTEHREKAWVIRVTGTDLDVIPRYRFSKKDRIVEAAAAK